MNFVEIEHKILKFWEEKKIFEKLRKKNIDMICLNDVTRKDAGFNSDDNQVTIFQVLDLCCEIEKREGLVHFFRSGFSVVASELEARKVGRGEEIAAMLAAIYALACHVSDDLREPFDSGPSVRAQGGRQALQR